MNNCGVKNWGFSREIISDKVIFSFNVLGKTIVKTNLTI